MKIESFAGVFQFAGTDRKFSLVEGELRIGPFSINEASGVLAAIEDRAGVQPAEVAKPIAHPNHVEEERTRREVEPPAKPKRAKAAAAEPPKVEPVKAAEPKADDGDDIPFGQPEPEHEAKPAGGNGSALAEQVKAGEAAASPDLAGARRLVDVIIALQEQGIVETDAIVAECERLRPTVALLDRIPDMRDRVERALSTLGQ